MKAVTGCTVDFISNSQVDFYWKSHCIHHWIWHILHLCPADDCFIECYVQALHQHLCQYTYLYIIGNICDLLSHVWLWIHMLRHFWAVHTSLKYVLILITFAVWPFRYGWRLRGLFHLLDECHKLKTKMSDIEWVKWTWSANKTQQQQRIDDCRYWFNINSLLLEVKCHIVFDTIQRFLDILAHAIAYFLLFFNLK